MEMRIAFASLQLLTALAVLTQDAAAASTAAETTLLRWRRQAIHCQPGDAACAHCSASCDAVEASRLPECCEAYGACCDQYFKACKVRLRRRAAPPRVGAGHVAFADFCVSIAH